MSRPPPPAPEAPPPLPPAHESPAERGPVPLGTLMVVGVVVLVTLFMWMLVLGVQQGRA